MVFIGIILIILIAAIIFSKKNILNGKKYFVVTVAAVFIIYTCFRGILETTDVYGYLNKFARYADYTFAEIIEIFNGNVKSPFYHFVGWVVAQVIPNGRVWISLIGTFYLCSVMYVLYKESPSPLLSIAIYIALGFFTFSLTGLRQTFAMGFTILAYLPAKHKKPIKFLILVCLGALFHPTALVFLLLYPLANRRLGLFQVLLMVFTLMVFLFFQGELRNLIAVLFEDSYLGGYSGQTIALSYSGLIIQLAIFVFALVYYSKVTKKYKNSLILYNTAFLGIIFQLFASMIAEFFRLSMYFSIFNMMLVPLALSTEENTKVKNVLTLIIYTVLIVYTFRGGIPNYPLM